MIISRTLAKSRIAQGHVPGRLAAWGPVFADAVILFGILFAIFPWLIGLLADLNLWVKVLVLFLVYFVPIQMVLITSAFWAAKSQVPPSDDSDQPRS